MRIDKLLSNLKYGSRNDIKKEIKKGNVKINDVITKEAKFDVDPVNDIILYNGELVYYRKTITLMMNKPKGYVSANKDNLHKTVFELLDQPYNRYDLNIAGRLDIDTEGLLILTNDGEYLHNIISPRKNVFKKYYVEVDQAVDFSKLCKPMTIKDGKGNDYTPLPPEVEQVNDKSLYLSIKEGKFHQVKRMCEQIGTNVVYLKRVSIGEIVLDKTLELGEYKEI